MKDKIIWILIAIFILVVLGVILLFGTKKSKKIDNIKTLHFSYSNGYSAYAYTRYDLELRNDGYYLDIKPYGVPEDEIQTVKVDKKTINKIIEILDKYEVSKWDGFSKSDKYVLDGDSFSFSLHADDLDVSANGYMRWPDNYYNVRDELHDLFDPLYEYKDDRVY